MICVVFFIASVLFLLKRPRCVDSVVLNVYYSVVYHSVYFCPPACRSGRCRASRRPSRGLPGWLLRRHWCRSRTRRRTWRSRSSGASPRAPDLHYHRASDGRRGAQCVFGTVWRQKKSRVRGVSYAAQSICCSRLRARGCGSRWRTAKAAACRASWTERVKSQRRGLSPSTQHRGL